MWLENLIFGTSLKCRPYPSSLKCQKAHCTQNCLNSNYANLLSEKKLSKICLIKSHFPNDLRVSIWYKMINRPSFETYKVCVMENDRKIVESIFEFCENERDVFEVYKCIIDIFGKKTGSKNEDDSKSADLKYDEDESKSADGKNDSKSEQKNEDETAAKEANNKETDNKDDSGKGTNSKSIDDKEAKDADDSSDVYDVKPVLKNSHENTISTHTTNDIYTSDDVDVDLLHLINYVLELPNCTKNLGYSILYTMFDRLQFDLVYFSASSYKNVPYKDMKSTLTNLIKSSKIDYLLDRVFIYGPSSLTKILATTKGYSEREIDNACKPLNVKEIIPVVETKKDEEYFDFLVVQNEVAKAQECLKKQLVDKIEELCEKNKELELRNANLKSYIEGMEENLKSYESKYVDEIKEMMSVVRSQNEHLQKENETLKKRAQERE